MTNTITYQASRKKGALLLFGSSVFVAIGIWMLPAEPILGWSSIGFFGLCGLVSILLLVPGASYLRLDASGFEVTSLWRKGITSWADVTQFDLVSIQGTRMIGISYRPEYARYKAARSVSNSMTGVEGAIPTHFDVPAEELLRTMRLWHARYTGTLA